LACGTPITAQEPMPGQAAAAFSTSIEEIHSPPDLIDADGFMTITDRSKDLIKSGGEWISSIDVENAAAACPGIGSCAVIGVPHAKWGERPLLVVVPKAGETLRKDDVLAFLAGRIARWQLPDDVVLIDALPMTATGKVSKKDLRVRFKDHALPDVERKG
jgi:fatty-acyl-CoA synthase